MKELLTYVAQHLVEHPEQVSVTETDAAVEKHVPVIQAEGAQVIETVGSVEHPMIPEHFIEWIALETREGVQIKHLTPGSKPQVVFALTQGDSVVSAYAYCNLHGLWKA